MELGIKPAVTVTVTGKGPFDGPVHVRVGTAEESRIHALGLKVANHVYVEIGNPPMTASAEGK